MKTEISGYKCDHCGEWFEYVTTIAETKDEYEKAITTLPPGCLVNGIEVRQIVACPNEQGCKGKNGICLLMLSINRK